MRKVKTDDGTITLYSEEYDQPFHSKSGALEECEKKYIIPCEVKEGDLILDVGFGLGFNTAAALDKNANVISLEKDETLFKEIQNLDFPLDSYQLVKEVAKGKESDRLKIILGDATETIKQIGEKFDAVFHDPFSPPKNPELWTEEFFKEVKKRMKKGAILATYSCARITRDNLKKAGFKVIDGPVVGRRSPSTLAINE
jgi:chorismate dehydratase